MLRRDEGVTYYTDSQIIAICDLIRTNTWEYVLKINRVGSACLIA
jgi:hypothetical protein